jgi:tight adherence protein C
VSLLASPVLMWLAALVCAAMAVRARPAARLRGPAGDPPLPLPVQLAARVRWPASLLRVLARADDERRLVRAGVAGSLSHEALRRVRAGGALAGALLALPLVVAWPPAVFLVPALGAAGGLAPTRWLGRREAARRRALVRELPDLLDLLGICVESGMALDPALQLAVERLGGTLGAEFERVLRDLAMGTPRVVAYRALVDRAGSPELARTVGALLQAEELGAPLSRALEGQAEALRVLRRQTARERAARAAPKIQLVVALLMVPAVLMLVLGALVIELSRQVGTVVGGP